MRGPNSGHEPAEPETTPRVDSVRRGSSADHGSGTGAAELQIEPGAAERIDRLVAGYVRSICALDTGDAEYQRTVETVERLGEREFVATAAMSGRLLDRRFHAMSGLLTSRAPMARRLGDLRKTVAELDPSRVKMGGNRSPRQELDELVRYFERFWRSQSRIEETLAALTEGRMMLEQDNAEIEQEERLLGTEMESLRQYALLAGRLDDALAAAIESFAATEPERAAALRSDVLYAVRRRHQSILTELAVATQGYAALRIVERNNHEVIRAVAEATTTTAAAMRTAVMVAQAAASQRATLEQLEAAAEATAAMADQADEMEARLPDTRSQVGMLQQAWAAVSTALDRVDAQKAEALRTISSADRELTGPKVGAPETDRASEPRD